MSQNAAAESRAKIQAAAKAVAEAVGDSVPYALVGGSACLMLGSQRLTADVDIVVPQGFTRPLRNLLKAAGKFTIEPRSLHTTHNGTNAEIEILSPPGLFRGNFDATTPTVSVQGIRILHPVLLLDAKCGSILGRANQTKKATDASDIAFLLRYIASHRIAVKKGDVPAANDAFVKFSVEIGYVPLEHWVAAGYVPDGGWPQ